MLAGGDPAGLEPRLRPRVADLDQRLLEQPVVVVDHPARLAETLGVGLVGDDLGLGHVQPHDPHQPGHGAGAAAAGSGDEQHLARVRRRVGQAELGQGGGPGHGGRAYRSASVAPMFASAGRRCSAWWCRRTTSRRTCRPAWTRCSPSRRRSGRPGSRWSSWTTARRTTSGEIAESYAARDPRVRVVHTENQGLGAARNEGLRHVTGDLLAFADSDDVVPPGSYAALLRQLTRTGSDFVAGSVARWESGRGRGPGRAALDEAAAPAADGPRHRRPAGDPRRRVRVEQAVPHRLLARRPGCPGPRGSATRTSRPPRWPTCAPGGSGSSPRSSTTGGSARTAPRSPSSAPRRRTCATAGRPS